MPAYGWRRRLYLQLRLPRVPAASLQRITYDLLVSSLGDILNAVRGVAR